MTDFGIYDISSEGRPNVFLELGIAIGMEKPYYIVARNGTTVPADLAGLDRIDYGSFQDLIIQVRDKIVKKHFSTLFQADRNILRLTTEPLSCQ